MVKDGQITVVHFVGRIAEGEERGAVFNTSNVDVTLAEGIYHGHRDYKTLEFRVVAGNVMAGIDETVNGMAVGETKTVQIKPEQAFGLYSEAHIVEVPLNELKAQSDITAEEGNW